MPNGVTTKASLESPLDLWLTRAKSPLTETIEMFRPGGTYGAGQRALIEEEGKRRQAEALANQVATGMGSGALATSTGLRVGRDIATQKLGVEDVRTQFLNQALQALSGLYGQFAGLGLQRELGLGGLAQQERSAEMDALSRLASARTGLPTKQYTTPWETAWREIAPSTSVSEYNIPRR
jgi:hypothetical protein